MMRHLSNAWTSVRADRRFFRQTTRTHRPRARLWRSFGEALEPRRVLSGTATSADVDPFESAIVGQFDPGDSTEFHGESDPQTASNTSEARSKNATSKKGGSDSTRQNDPPIAVNDSRSINEDASPNTITGNLLNNDSDPNGDSIKIAQVEGSAANIGVALSGSYGSIKVASNGGFTYTLNNANSTVDALVDGESLVDVFDYAITDIIDSGSGGKDQITLTTYFGGSRVDTLRDLFIDDDGNIYATGGTNSTDFVTTQGAYQRSLKPNPLGSSSLVHDVWVAKFSATGNLIWSTLLGGPEYDRAYAIEVDDTGIYVGGRAGRSFPTTAGALQRNFAGDSLPNPKYGLQDGFVSKLSLDGSRLLWSTYFGDSGRSFVRDIDVDDSGHVYVAEGYVHVSNPHVTSGAFQTSKPGAENAVVAKLKTDGSGVVWATYLGGSGEDHSTPSIRVGPQGEVVVVGSSDSTNYPVSSTAHQKSRAGSSDFVITSLRPDGSDINFSTYLGGSGTEDTETHSVQIDSQGNIFIGGTTNSANFPTTNGAVQRSIGGDYDGAVAKFDRNGRLLAATFLGGGRFDELEGVDVDAQGRVVVTGSVSSTSVPSAGGIRSSGGVDGIVARMSPDLSRIDYAKLLGGSRNDSTRTLDINGDTIVVGGQTVSSDLPVTNNSKLANPASNTMDAMIVRIASSQADTPKSDTARLSVTIHGSTDNRSPVAVADHGQIKEDAASNPLTGNVLSNDTDADNDALTVSRVNGSGALVDTSLAGKYGTLRIQRDGAYTYTLNNANSVVNALNDGDNLVEIFAYTASDGVASDDSTLRVSISGSTDNRAPVATDDRAHVTEDSPSNPVRGNALTNDSDPDGDSLLVARVNGSSVNVGSNVRGRYGTFRIERSGAYSYTLDNTLTAVNSLGSGQTLQDTFSLLVSDGQQTAASTVFAVIHGNDDPSPEPENRPPTANRDTASIVEDASSNRVTGNVLTNDTDPDGDELSVVRAHGSSANVGRSVAGSYGSLQLDADGRFVYTLDNANPKVDALGLNQSLRDEFSYRVSDATDFDDGTLSITIVGRHDNLPPDPVADRNVIVEDFDPAFVSGNVLSNDNDPDGDTLSVVRLNGQAENVGRAILGTYGAIFLKANGAYDYILDNRNPAVDDLDAGDSLRDSFAYTVSDSTVVASTTLTITIEGVTDVTDPEPEPTPAGTSVGLVGRSGSKLIGAVAGDRQFIPAEIGEWTNDVNWQFYEKGDFNGDGVEDVIGRAANGKWWVGTASDGQYVNGLWGQWSADAKWSNVFVGDVNGDGKSDVIGQTNGVWYVAKSTGHEFENERWGKWSKKVTWNDVMSADINGDGRTDMIGRLSNGAWWGAMSTGSDFENQQIGTWSGNLNWQHVRAADVDGDGLDDVVGMANGTWWVGRSTGQALVNQKWGAWSTKVNWETVRIGDFDGDGRSDIVGRAHGAWWVARSTGDQFVNEKWGVWSTNVPWRQIRVGDFDGDGRDDLAGHGNGEWLVGRSTESQFTNEVWGRWSDDWSHVLVSNFAAVRDTR